MLIYLNTILLRLLWKVVLEQKAQKVDFGMLWEMAWCKASYLHHSFFHFSPQLISSMDYLWCSIYPSSFTHNLFLPLSWVFPKNRTHTYKVLLLWVINWKHYYFHVWLINLAQSAFCISWDLTIALHPSYEDWHQGPSCCQSSYATINFLDTGSHCSWSSLFCL